MFNSNNQNSDSLGSMIIKVFIEIIIAFITLSIIAKFGLLIYGLISGIINELTILILVLISILSVSIVASTKTLIPNIGKSENLVKESWERGQPEYPMFILSGIIGTGLATGYYQSFCMSVTSGNYALYAGLLTVFASPFLLVTWKWRNTNKHVEFKNKKVELENQHRLANEGLLGQSGEQLGHDKEAVRLCGLQGIDRYARIMMNRDTPDYGEFQRAVNILCSYVRQNCDEERKSQPTSEPEDSNPSSALFNEYPTDYETSVHIIIKLMRDYYEELIKCIALPIIDSRKISSSVLSFPLLDLRKCDLHNFDFSGNILLISSDLSGANLNRANLQEANLQEAKLKGAHLEGANLAEANLKGAHLAGANLEGANLEKSNLTNADLTGANMRMSNLKDAITTGTIGLNL